MGISKFPPSVGVATAWEDLTGRPSSLAGYGITDAQPLDADLSAIAALTTDAFGRGLLTLATAAAVRSYAGLGTAATQDSTAFDAAGAAAAAQAAAQAASQPLDADLTAIAALATTGFGRGGLTQADGASFRAYVGAGTSSFSGLYADLSAVPANLAALAGLVGSAGAVPYFSGFGTMALFAVTAAGSALLTAADAAAQRSALGLGTAATAAATAFDAAGAAAAAQAASQPLDPELTALAGLASAANGIPYFTGSGTASTLTRDTDGALAANSDARVATQKAVKTYVDATVTGLLEFQGNIDCSANPNYPAALKGDTYVVSVAGRIGGAAGVTVDPGDSVVASADNAGGTQAAVGSSWFTLQHTLQGALLANNNLSDLASPAAALANLGGQPLDAELTAIAGLVGAADRFPYFTGPGAAALGTVTAFSRTLLDDPDAATARGTLGLGTLATQDGTFSGSSSGVNTGDQVGTAADPGTATLPTDQVRLQYDRMALSGSGRLTLAGTSRLAVLTLAAPATPYLGSPKVPRSSFAVATDYFLEVLGRLTIAGAMRVTLEGTADLFVSAPALAGSRLVLGGRG